MSESAKHEAQSLRSIAQDSTSPLISMRLGGGISPQLIEGRKAGKAEKVHLVIRRLLRQKALAAGIEFLDLGTDSFYPFFQSYTPTLQALRALGEYVHTARWYPSSFGLLQLREEAQKFMRTRFNVHVDMEKELMITAGASQAFDALSRTFQGDFFLLPDLAISTIHTIAIANGARPIRIPLQPATGLLDVDAAALLLERAGRPTVRFLYLNYPHNPTGTCATTSFFAEVIAFAKEFGVLIVHDMDSWYLTHLPGLSLPNILEVQGAKDVAITLLSFSKEFGLPGIRIALVAGNVEVINALRIHNSEYSVMLPEPCQYAALAALRSFREDQERISLSYAITDIMRFSIEAWQMLGWPEHAIYPPATGYKYLLAVPPSFQQVGDISGAELFDFYVAKNAYVKLSTSRAFNVDNGNFIRVILMQDRQAMEEVFRRLQGIGLHYDMEMPPNLADEYHEMLGGIDLAHL